MAFSGKYAAAQLGKLDHSPLFRGYTFPLAAEVSAYLGNVNDLVPPTFLRWSRLLGRLVAVNPVETIIVLTDELEGFDCVVTGSYTVFNGVTWVVESATGTMEEHFRAGRTPIFDVTISIPMTDEDVRFYVRWERAHRNRWPNMVDDTWHPTLRRLINVFHDASWESFQRGNRRMGEIHRRNRTILFPDRIAETDSEIDSDEEL